MHMSTGEKQHSETKKDPEKQVLNRAAVLEAIRSFEVSFSHDTSVLLVILTHQNVYLDCSIRGEYSSTDKENGRYTISIYSNVSNEPISIFDLMIFAEPLESTATVVVSMFTESSYRGLGLAEALAIGLGKHIRSKIFSQIRSTFPHTKEIELEIHDVSNNGVSSRFLTQYGDV